MQQQYASRKEVYALADRLGERDRTAVGQLSRAVQTLGREVVIRLVEEAEEQHRAGTFVRADGQPRALVAFFLLLKERHPEQRKALPQPMPPPAPQRSAPAQPVEQPELPETGLATMIAQRLRVAAETQAFIRVLILIYGAEAAITALRRASKTEETRSFAGWAAALPRCVPPPTIGGASMKTTLSGRPDTVEEHAGGTIIIYLTVAKGPTSFPKGVPAPPALATPYRVFGGAKQWQKAKVVEDDPQDALIIEGFAMIVPDFPGITMYATSVRARSEF